MQTPDWLKGRAPFRMEQVQGILRKHFPGGFVIRDHDGVWIAVVPVEGWAKSLVEILNEQYGKKS